MTPRGKSEAVASTRFRTHIMDMSPSHAASVAGWEDTGDGRQRPVTCEEYMRRSRVRIVALTLELDAEREKVAQLQEQLAAGVAVP